MCGAQIFGTDPAGPNAVPGDAGWFTEGSRVRMYSGRRPEDDGDGAIGATGRLRGQGATGTSVSDDAEGLQLRVPSG